jgi:hypothetical protein
VVFWQNLSAYILERRHPKEEVLKKEAPPKPRGAQDTFYRGI